MSVERFKERAEFLALRVIVTRLLSVAIETDPKLSRSFAEAVDRTIDTFDFTDGWADSDVTRGREYMRMAADWIIRPALKELRGKRR